MSELVLRFLKALPSFVSIVAATFTVAFLFQVSLLTLTIPERLIRTWEEDHHPVFSDYLWFTYAEIPSALPGILVFSTGIVIVLFISGSYFRKIHAVWHIWKHCGVRGVFNSVELVHLWFPLVMLSISLSVLALLGRGESTLWGIVIGVAFSQFSFLVAERFEGFAHLIGGSNAESNSDPSDTHDHDSE